jgi:hypothetical protein
MPHDAVSGYLRHERIGIVNTLSPAELERERYGVGQVARIGGRELVVVGHRRTIAEARERSKNNPGVDLGITTYCRQRGRCSIWTRNKA